MKRPSEDGTMIAFHRTGSGPPLILVDAALCHRGVVPNSGLAEPLSKRFTVITYDRRGRGESSDSSSYAVAREVENLAALIDDVGGTASLYGISSGGALALEAARRMPDKVDKLALFEIPFVVDDSRPAVRGNFADELTRLIASDQRGAAVKLFMREAVRLPAPLVAAMPLFVGAWKKNKALAHTLPYDAAIMGDLQRGNSLPADRWNAVTMPALVMDGGKSPAWVRHGMTRLAQVLPNAEHRTLEGQRHHVKPAAIAPVLEGFLTDGSPATPRAGLAT